MSTLHQLREGLNEAWGSLREGWQRLRDALWAPLGRLKPEVVVIPSGPVGGGGVRRRRQDRGAVGGPRNA